MIRVEGIRKVFNKRTRNANEVLKGVSFELPDKGLVAIFGKSGSGKTTLLNIIGGLDKQNSGKIFIDNENVAGKVDKIRNAKIGFIFQNYYLESGYTIEEIMANAMIIAGFKDKKEIKNRTEQVLKLVKMDRYKHKTADALSGGQKQRVAIARALIKGSDVILADEPTGNLDSENTIIIMDILKEISKTQLVVLVTHEVNLIYKYADSHIKLVDGELQNDANLDEKIEVEVEKNNIYANELPKRTINIDNTNLNIYGENISSDDISIFSDKGNIYIQPGKNVHILDSKSEKKVIFEEPKVEEKFEEVPKFEKSTSKKNGKLFRFLNVWKSRHYNGEEKAYSTGNIFKQIFVGVMAILMSFCSFSIYEITNKQTQNKAIDENSVYVDMRSYSEIRKLDESLYESIDFFNMNYEVGEFAYKNQQSISAIKEKYAPKSLQINETAKDANLVFGEMPGSKEVLITRKLADNLKYQLRYKEFQSDKAIMLLQFNKDYRISGICKGNEPYIYFNRVDYVNFLNVYSDIKLQDSTNLFFENSFLKDETNETIEAFSAEIAVYDGTTIDLNNNEAVIEINRSSTYKMMTDSKDADYKIEKANKVLLHTPQYISIFNSYPVYVREFNLNRNEMTTDIKIYISTKTLENIFTFISPNLDSLSKDTNYYFEITTASQDQLNSLLERLEYRSCVPVDIKKIYKDQHDTEVHKSMMNLLIFVVVGVLLYTIYYFIEKSSSIKNSKEYGVFRAIGINKSNLLYKETILAIKDSLITYSISFIVMTILISVRYFMLNVPIWPFIGISALVMIISSLVMVGISLIPYLFVLYKTPSEIISRYDI